MARDDFGSSGESPSLTLQTSFPLHSLPPARTLDALLSQIREGIWAADIRGE